jgi:hypothetical protein
MSLRDQVIADLPTFLDVGEFGDTVDIDGIAMACVLVNDDAPTDDVGVEVLESTLYARASDFVQLPVVRQRLTVGTRQANVTRVDEEQGMLVVRLRWFDS